MTKSLKHPTDSDNNKHVQNQFVLLINDIKSEVDNLLDKISDGKEFELIFNSGKANILNKERYIYLLKYINLVGHSESYHMEGPADTLDVSLSLDTGETCRISVNNEPGIDNIKKVYSNLIQKSSNYSVFKMLLYLAKKSNDKKKYSMLKKTRSRDNTVDIDEFAIRAKLSEETDIFDDVVSGGSNLSSPIKRMLENDKFSYDEIVDLNQKIFFRYKQRTSLYFHRAKAGKEYIRMDLTYVKSHKDINRLNSSISEYELELELVADKITPALKTMMYDNSEKIIKLLQQSNYIVTRKTENDVIDYYKSLLLNNSAEKITALDGRQPVSLEIQHVVDILPDNYAVTDKADGDRYFLIIRNEQVYLISNNLRVKDTGIVLSSSNGKKYNGTVLDGEYIFIHKYNRHVFMAFDCLAVGGEDVRRTDLFLERIERADQVISDCFVTKEHKGYIFGNIPLGKEEFNLDTVSKFHTKELANYYDALINDLKIPSKFPVIRRKYFIPVMGAKKWEIFKYASLFWKCYSGASSIEFPYLLDGLIFQPLVQAYVTNASDSGFLEYKWKPASHNSIDFYIEFKKDPMTGKSLPVYDNTNDIKNKTYKICNLYVGKHIQGKEQPVPFDQNGSTGEAYIFLDNGEARDVNGDIITDKTVVEFYYNNEAGIPENHRWVPLRTRHDKTEFVEKYKRRYGNYSTIANKVWRSIINPVTMSDMDDLAQGGMKYNDKIQELNGRVEHTLVISAAKENQYYQKITKLGKFFRQFHNWIKSNVIYTYCHHMYKNNKQQSVLDIGCGRGGDNMKYYYSEVAFYVGIDLSQDGIMSPVDGAISRYNQMRKKKPNFPKMHFIHADARSLLTYKDQARALSGMTSDNAKLLNKFFPETGQKTLFDIINCQFAVHYFLENKQSWSNYKTNISNHLRAGGFYLVTTFSGKRIRRLVAGKEKYTEYYTDESGEKKILFEIIKRFNDDDKPQEGLKIDFYAAWMFKEGTYISEYIVDEEFFETQLDTDCDLEMIDFDYFENQYEIHRDYLTSYNKYQSVQETRQFLTSAGMYYNDTELNKGCRNFTNLNCLYTFRKRDSVKNQKGGKYDFSDASTFNIPDMNNYNNEYSFFNSIHNILQSHKLIPKSIKVSDMCQDFGLNVLKDYELDHRDIKKVCKKSVIKHEFSETESKIVLSGLNIVTVERDCNNHYDIEYTTASKKPSKYDAYVILMKEGHLYKPIYDNTKNTGIFKASDEIVNFIKENGEHIEV